VSWGAEITAALFFDKVSQLIFAQLNPVNHMVKGVMKKRVCWLGFVKKRIAEF